MNKTKEHYHSLLKVTTFRVSPSSGKITKLSQKKSHLRRNEKRDLSEHQHHASQLVKKEEKEWNEEIYPIKAPEQKISESKNHKAAETISPKNGKLHVEKTPGGEKRTWQWPPRNNILSAIMAPRKNQPPRSPRPRTKKTVYEKCRSRGSQIGFKSLPFWMLQVFSTIAIYMASFFNLLPQWVSLHSTSALSKSNR